MASKSVEHVMVTVSPTVSVPGFPVMEIAVVQSERNSE